MYKDSSVTLRDRYKTIGRCCAGHAGWVWPVNPGPPRLESDGELLGPRVVVEVAQYRRSLDLVLSSTVASDQGF